MIRRTLFHDRMKQAVDDEIAGCDRVGDRVHQERHVVVDDRHPHEAAAMCDRFQLQRRLAGCTDGSSFSNEGGGLRAGLVIKPVQLSW